MELHIQVTTTVSDMVAELKTMLDLSPCCNDYCIAVRRSPGYYEDYYLEDKVILLDDFCKSI